MSDFKTTQDIELAWHEKGVTLWLIENRVRIQIAKIVVPKEFRGYGIGSRVISDILAYAQSKRKPVTLTASESYGSNMEALKRFYARFGFVENTGDACREAFTDSFYWLPSEASS